MLVYFLQTPWCHFDTPVFHSCMCIKYYVYYSFHEFDLDILAMCEETLKAIILMLASKSEHLGRMQSILHCRKCKSHTLFVREASLCVKDFSLHFVGCFLFNLEGFVCFVCIGFYL